MSTWYCLVQVDLYPSHSYFWCHYLSTNHFRLHEQNVRKMPDIDIPDSLANVQNSSSSRPCANVHGFFGHFFPLLKCQQSRKGVFNLTPFGWGLIICLWDFGVSLVCTDDFLAWYVSELRLKGCVEPRDISVDRGRDDQSRPDFDWLSSFLHSCTLFSWPTLWNLVLMDDLLFWPLGLTAVHPWSVSLDAPTNSSPSELPDLASTTLFKEGGSKLFCNSSCLMKFSP